MLVVTLEISYLFVTLQSKIHFFDFSVQRLAARFARGKKYFFGPFSTKVSGALRARQKLLFVLTFQHKG